MKFDIKSLKLLTETGADNYPINLRKGLIVELDAVNMANKSFESVKMDASVWYWGSFFGLFKCGWRIIPNFGVLLAGK